jgi:hypothetical protein
MFNDFASERQWKNPPKSGLCGGGAIAKLWCAAKGITDL